VIGEAVGRDALVGEKVVVFDDGGHGQLGTGSSTFDAHYITLAADADAFRQRDLRRQGESEIDGGASLDGGVDIEADSAGADVASLGQTFLGFFAVADVDRQTKREAPRGSLVIFVLVRIGHWHFTSQVSRFQSFKVSTTYCETL
jgi:hypothetical protein